MATTTINVNQHVIRANHKHGTHKPPIRVLREDGTIEYGTEVTTAGPVRLIYRPTQPLKCGARVWLETEGEVAVW